MSFRRFDESYQGWVVQPDFYRHLEVIFLLYNESFVHRGIVEALVRYHGHDGYPQFLASPWTRCSPLVNLMRAKSAVNELGFRANTKKVQEFTHLMIWVDEGFEMLSDDDNDEGDKPDWYVVDSSDVSVFTSEQVLLLLAVWCCWWYDDSCKIRLTFLSQDSSWMIWSGTE